MHSMNESEASSTRKYPPERASARRICPREANDAGNRLYIYTNRITDASIAVPTVLVVAPKIMGMG